jgi:hypothetical protein
MCVVCTEWAKGNLTSSEAIRALGEMISTSEKDREHYYEVAEKIAEEDEQSSTD